MTSREKFLSVMRMEPGEYRPGIEIPKVEFGYWAGTVRRWFGEGLPQRVQVPADIPDGEAIMANRNIREEIEKAGDMNIQPVFGLDQHLTKFPVDYSPGFKRQILEEHDGWIVYRDSFGVTIRNRAGFTSLPEEIDSPVKDWKTWGAYKERYQESGILERFPAEWPELVKSLKDRDFPIRLGGTFGGFLGFPRQIMGLMTYSLTLHDDPALIHDICDTFLHFLISYYDRILRDVQVDCILIWEDMAGRQGSLISPTHFREFLAPRYRVMTGFAREMGVDIVLVDSDGFVEELIPLIAETGVTGMYPFERAAGNELERIRDAFPRFQILGGFDKRVLFDGCPLQRIDEELAMVERMLARGRYIPHVDHFVSQDCTLRNFSYYRERLNRIIDEMTCFAYSRPTASGA